MIRRPAPTPDPVPGNAAPAEDSPAVPRPAPAVRLTKRTPPPPPDPEASRDKICAECGVRFRLEPGKKFFLCPDCYRRSFTYRQRGGREAARVLTHITCAQCGTEAYVPFLPEDPAKALCPACFAEARQKTQGPAKPSRR